MQDVSGAAIADLQGISLDWQAPGELWSTSQPQIHVQAILYKWIHKGLGSIGMCRADFIQYHDDLRCAFAADKLEITQGMLICCEASAFISFAKESMLFRFQL